MTKQSSQLLGLAESGNKAVEKMVLSSQEIKKGMDHFNEAMQRSMEQLATALKVIQEIASKTEVINTIVFQTKLLSFNSHLSKQRAPAKRAKDFQWWLKKWENLRR